MVAYLLPVDADFLMLDEGPADDPQRTLVVQPSDEPLRADCVIFHF
jgi:hypothetical protein